MQRLNYRFLVWSFIIALTVFTVQSSGVDAATPKQHPPTTSPTLDASTSDILSGIAGLSPDNIWVVGSTMNFFQFTGWPLIEHWNGDIWLISPSPATPPNALGALIGITAITQNDIWAVGSSMVPNGTRSQALIEHWNGADWQIVTSPAIVKAGSLLGIASSGPNDIWAVGNSSSALGASSQPLTLHWDGSSWHSVPVASAPKNSSLQSITSLKARDVWAVGEYPTAQGSKALIEHWNGSTWQTLLAPPSTMSSNNLFDVAALSDHDIWAIGNSFSQPSQVSPSIDHWNGSSWQAISTSGLPTSFLPKAISATGRDNIWITGNQALAHWNGASWQSFPITSPQGVNSLSAILVLAHDNIWTIDSNSESYFPLIANWYNSNWLVVEMDSDDPFHCFNYLSDCFPD